MNPAEKTYVVVVQCEQAVGAACSGFMCEHAFSRRADAFAGYPAGVRYNAMSCGGCPGRPVLRKLMNLKRNLMKREETKAERAVAHLSTCIVRASHHGPPCPHLEYIKAQVARAGFDLVEGSRFSPRAEKLRSEGVYESDSGI